MEQKEKLQWKGHGPLTIKEGQIAVPRGFQPKHAIQFIPAAPITALAFHSSWHALAAGTCHGFGLIDLENKKVATTHCTVSDEGRPGINHASEIIYFTVLGVHFACLDALTI